jgi:polyribonucleotide nucleotidyltransferase
MNVITKSVEIDGKTLQFETGKIAKQADGSTVLRMGDTMVLVTACSEDSQRQGVDFMPLTVDYRENTYAGGRIPGGFFKREGRPTEREILTCRLIDRGLRPLFPDGFYRETQVIAWVISADNEFCPDIYGISGASLALLMSAKIPFEKAIAGVRVGRVDGKLVVFPTYEQQKRSDLDLTVAATDDALAMVECGANELPESVILDALDLAHREIKKIIALQREFVAELGIGKSEFTPAPSPWSEDFAAAIRGRWMDELREALKVRGKFEQKAAADAVRAKALAELPAEEADEKTSWVKNVFYDMVKAITRETILVERKRLDGRAFDQIRQVTCEVGVLPRSHGSALFTRGETQALVTCTLGTSDDSQLVEAFEGDSRNAFMLHYNFPPFSVGEAKFLRGPGRREIGHGALARRALLAVLPSPEEFPYTLRIVSDILESNGSSSMASVCGGSMAMMDAGAPLKSAVAGIAMGLVSEGDKYAILTDIAGQEDHYGDMDFKVAGTANGITALQMDIKVEGLSRHILEEAMEQARKGRLQLLESMASAIDKGRDDISPFAPRIIQIKIEVDQIRNVIGPGGKMIRHIVDTTGAKINVEDDGTVQIATADMEAAQKAIQMIEGLTKQPLIGEEFDGVARRIEPYGAFVEILPGRDGLVHISELSLERIPDIRDVLNEGDELRVRIIDIDANDRIKLSRRVILEDEARERGEEIPERDTRPPRDDRGGRPGGRGRPGGGRDRGPRRN